MNKKILVALPTTGYYHYLAVNSILGMQIPEGYDLGFKFMSNCLVYDAREKLCEGALKEGFDYILFMDDDMVIPNHAVRSFLDCLDNGFDMVTGMIFKRSYPYQPCFYPKARLRQTKRMVNGKEEINFIPDLEGCISWDKDSIIPLEGMGMACCMLKVSMLEKIKKPWFYPFPHVGEDLTFCIKARQEANVKMCVDTRVDVGHITEATVTSEFQKEALAQWEDNPDNKGKLLYMEGENE